MLEKFLKITPRDIPDDGIRHCYVGQNLEVLSFFCTYAYRVRELRYSQRVSYSKMWQGQMLNHQVLLWRKSVLSLLRADNSVSNNGSSAQP